MGNEVPDRFELRFRVFAEVCLAVLGTLAGTIGKQMVRCSRLAKERRKQKEGNVLLIAGNLARAEKEERKTWKD